MVCRHRGQRHTGRHDNARRGGKTADENQQRQPVLAVQQGQQEDKTVRFRFRQTGDQAGQRDRHDKEIDDQQVEREQPPGKVQLGLASVLDNQHMKLPRQQDHGHRGTQNQRQPGADFGSLPQLV